MNKQVHCRMIPYFIQKLMYACACRCINTHNTQYTIHTHTNTQTHISLSISIYLYPSIYLPQIKEFDPDHTFYLGPHRIALLTSPVFSSPAWAPRHSWCHGGHFLAHDQCPLYLATLLQSTDSHAVTNDVWAKPGFTHGPKDQQHLSPLTTLLTSVYRRTVAYNIGTDGWRHGCIHYQCLLPLIGGFTRARGCTVADNVRTYLCFGHCVEQC